ncbi:BnaC05g13290D [Brassica napus]|uniref:(rape) hypothetical protein n=1 Tax=Brassica napus TaxID=3708 RepID=A0A078IGE4_BRANA|nr:unnamed protein product [Brassica napus]CDY48469.1 BnaC05g13290D [Brassica napus]
MLDLKLFLYLQESLAFVDAENKIDPSSALAKSNTPFTFTFICCKN